MILGFLAVLSCLSALPGQVPARFEWDEGPTERQLRMADIVAIVKPTGPPTVSSRKALPSSTGYAPSAGLPVTVESGWGCSKGDTFIAVFPHGNPFKETPSAAAPARLPAAPDFGKGKSYLMVALRQKGGHLFFPPATPGWPDKTILEAADGKDVAAVLMIETPGATLPAEGNLLDCVYAAAIDCMGAKDAAVVRAACRFLFKLPPGKATRPTKHPLAFNPTATYCPDDPRIGAVKSHLEKASARVRALLWGLLLRWRVPDSLRTYRDSLAALASVPDDGSLPYDDLELVAEPGDYIDLDGVCDFEPDRWLELLFAARSDRLRCYFLDHFVPILPEADSPRFGRLLNLRDPEVRLRVVNILASVTRTPEHHVIRYERFPEGQTFEEVLAREVAYWKRRLGVR